MKEIIGKKEWCSLPGLNIPAIKAKVDSGAKTSALHAFNIQSFDKNGEEWVSFEVHPLQNNRKISLKCESKVIDRRNIKSSSGAIERRYVIRELLELNDTKWEIEITLSNRDTMGYRMLIGRQAMNDRLVIDPSMNFCMGEILEERIEELYKFAPRIKEGLNIALLASNPELYSNRRIIEAAEDRGHNVTFLNIKHCYIKLDSITPEVHYRGKKALDMFDAVIPRVKPNLTYYACALLRQFETINVLCLNTSASIRQSRDKLFSSQILLKDGVDIPLTGFANSPLDTDDLIEMVGGAPLIVKLLEGTQGKGVVLTETKKAAESVINAFKSLKANILIQEFIKEAQGKDIRCFVIDGKVVASIQRTAAQGEFRANLHQGGTASLIKITPEEKKIAIKAAKVFNLKVAGVDIIRSSRGPLVLEVNSSPGLEGIETATGKDIASLLIKSIENNFHLND